MTDQFDVFSSVIPSIIEEYPVATLVVAAIMHAIALWLKPRWRTAKYLSVIAFALAFAALMAMFIAAGLPRA